MVHMPWMDFEEHINFYRMQDTMFVERNGTFNSADFGFTFGGFFGGPLDGVKYYPGRYGSFAVGAYNGGGYHALEKNDDKVFEGRVTLRPFPDDELTRGLQVSLLGITGKGNTAEEPEWSVGQGMLSYEHPRGVVTATYYTGKGNQKGTAVEEATGDSLDREGWSIFGELYLPTKHDLSLIGRYDVFDFDTSASDDEQARVIAGVAWDMGWRPGHPGILAVQAATYRWLRQHFPNMRVISNEASGTPTQFFSDSILIENGIVYGKSWYDYEVTKAFNTYCATIERPEFFVRLADGVLSGKPNWPWRGGAADAKRFIDHLTSTPAFASIPADQRNREAAFRTNVRAGLRDLAMGSNWGYADMTQLAFGRKLPGELIQFMTEIPAIPTITRSYALRLNGKSDRDGDLYGAGWCDSKRLRLAVWNDSTNGSPFSLSLDGQTLSEHGWPSSAPVERRTHVLATDGTARRSEVEWRGTLEGLSIRASLPPFTLLILSAGVK